ncbi:unnamed protein product [Protopolystoma xenopodis]|uniref:Neurotransmitter-gated ion-channel ligand-binding domain-containing protein n=1 Tax=Protopolystoma xenopodis TaxID=117903 RepID=A0A3S5AAK3_9PLAT|nr:unnamed protein product [Protopolystoma xenopodis]
MQAADERLQEHREARVVVSSDGSALWILQALYKSLCQVEITYFPFDLQEPIIPGRTSLLRMGSNPEGPEIRNMQLD